MKNETEQFVRESSSLVMNLGANNVEVDLEVDHLSVTPPLLGIRAVTNWTDKNSLQEFGTMMGILIVAPAPLIDELTAKAISARLDRPREPVLTMTMDP